ncbi:MAG: pyruvate kinase [Patescibacteria group bacterium]
MRQKQTKIIATVSDQKCDPEFIRSLHDNGVDAIRLNTAHQTHSDTLRVIKNIRKVSERIAIILDTKGPEIRTCLTDGRVILKKGGTVKIAGSNEGKVSTNDLVYVNYPGFVKDVPEKTTILIDDGELGLKVIKKNPKHLLCEVLNDGEIKPNKSINIPNLHLNLPSLSGKDRDYINFAIRHNLDFIAHSFVRNKEDILAIQKILDKHNSKIKIIAKIENQEGVDNIEEILDYSYGVMVARGDLGVEIPAEEIPLIQKKIIKICIARHEPVITATQMMHSMIKSSRPTRAEVSDVANAILDGTDAIMLSGETAYGDYPIEAVRVMAKIIQHTEANTESTDHLPAFKGENAISNFLAKSAVIASRELGAKEIIISAASGFSAEVIASYRGRVPIFVKCFDKKTARGLALTYGINAHVVKKEENHKRFLKNLFTSLVKKGKLAEKDKVIYLAGDVGNNSITNFMEICEVGKYVGLASPNKKL